MKLSAALIVRDEEPFLAQCLDSIKGLVNEIVVVDTGSTDRTVEIAREFGARVEHFAWIDDFAAARNHALSLCLGDWILSIDGDESLAPESVEAFKELPLDSAEICGYNFAIKSPKHERTADGTFSIFRMFPNRPGIRWTGRIGEQIYRSLHAVTGKPAADAPVLFLHYGYLREVRTKKRKFERNLRIWKQEAADHPGDPRIAFALSDELISEFTDREDWAAAVAVSEKSFEHAIRNVKRLKGLRIHSRFVRHCFLLNRAGRRADAIKAAELGLKVFPGSPELLYEMAGNMAILGDTANASKVLEDISEGRGIVEHADCHFSEVRKAAGGLLGKIRALPQ